MDKIIDITLVNPFNPAFLILAGVAITVLVVGLLIASMTKKNSYDEGWGVLVVVLVAGASLIAFLLISFSDEDALDDRLETELNDLGYSYVDLDYRTLTATDPDGNRVSGIYVIENNENVTVAVR